MSNPQSPHEWESSEIEGQRGEAGETGCSEVEALLAAYAIGATDPEETAFVQARLAGCPETASQLAGFHTLGDALLASASPVEPPAALADRLARAVSAGTERPAPRTARSVKPRWRASWSWGGLWSVAATTAVLLLAALNLYTIQQNTQLRHQLDQLAAAQAAQVQTDTNVYLLLGSEDRQTIALPAAQNNSQANAQVLWDPDLGVAMLYAKAFPALAPNQVYQLWLTRNGERQSGGLFSVDQNGTGLLIFPVAQPLDHLDSMGITPEPSGGSPGPTSPPVVRRRFTSS